MRMLRSLLLGPQALFALSTCYLLMLLGAAAFGRRKDTPSLGTTDQLRFIVLIPAHDEELIIAKTLASVRCMEHTNFEVVVVADNCGDRTAELALGMGATVYERRDTSRRGKGYALAWALERLRTERAEWDALVVLDADCRPSPNLLAAVEARLRAGAMAVQADDVVANPGDSWPSGLRFAAFALINTIQALGKDRLGLSCGLFGTGMGFTRELLVRYPWEAFSLAEDGEYHFRLVNGGERVVFAPEAFVDSAMPTSLQESTQQQLRWEGGRWELIRTWSLKMIRDGLLKRDPVRLHAGVEPLVPPQSLLMAGNAGLMLLAAGLRSRAGFRLSVATLLGQACYILGGLMLVRAPVKVYQALALAPILVVWKVGLYLRIFSGRGSNGWIRTSRRSDKR